MNPSSDAKADDGPRLTKAFQTEKPEPQEAEINKELVDKASSIQGLFFATGGFIGPLISGALEDAKGFVFTVDFMASIVAGFAIIYFGVIFAYP